MRLFGKLANQLNRHDRAEWLTPPFDRAVSHGIDGPYTVTAARAQAATAESGESFVTGPCAGEVDR